MTRNIHPKCEYYNFMDQGPGPKEGLLSNSIHFLTSCGCLVLLPIPAVMDRNFFP